MKLINLGVELLGKDFLNIIYILTLHSLKCLMAASVTIWPLWAWYNLVKYRYFPLIWSQWANLLLYYGHYGHGLVWPGIAMSHL